MFMPMQPGLYRCLTEPFMALTTWVIMGVSPDLDDDFVYELTRVVWDNVEIIHRASAGFIETQMENVRYVMMEVHPGAARFYRERGIELPTVPPPPRD
jgi:TRAP-type uncharacterized transport system substrate-binding protein